MRKINKYLAVAAFVTVLLPAVASAHDKDRKDDGDRDRKGIRIFNEDRDGKDRFENRFKPVDVDDILNANAHVRTGTVTAKGTNSFTLNANNGTTYTVNTANATFSLPFDGSFSFADLAVNDSVRVKGTISGAVITASSVKVMPVNKRAAVAKGTITAVSGSTLTLQTKGNNTVTVNTNSNTAVTNADGTAGTMANVQVDSMVKIKGLWDMVLNVLNAIRIKIS